MRVIDTHVHLVDDPEWVTATRLRALQRRFKVDDFRAATDGAVSAFVAVPAVPTVAETRRLLGLAAGSSSLTGVTGWVDLTAPDLAGTVDGLRSGPGGDRLRGIRHPVRLEPEPDWLARADVRRGLRVLDDHGLLFELLVRPDQIPAAAMAAKELPGLSLVVNHGAVPPLAVGPFDAWEADIRTLAAHPNVTCKISGPLVHADPAVIGDENIAHCVGVLVDAFGSERLMFGSNYPLCLLTGTYADLLRRTRSLLAGLTEPEQAHILSTTALRTYGRCSARV